MESEGDGTAIVEPSGPDRILEPVITLSRGTVHLSLDRINRKTIALVSI